jgi:DNA-binding NarL/FixJ family response regulator
VIILGPRRLEMEAVARALTHDVAGVGDVGVDGAHPSGNGHRVCVLVDPQPSHWRVAGRMGAPVVLISRDRLEPEAATRAVLRGADALLDLDASPAEVVDALSTVANGGTVIATDQARALAEAARTGPSVAPAQLTRRELDVLGCITDGQSVKQTARRLGIATKTVENVQSRLFRKLEVRNRAQVVSRAHDLGLA